MTPDTLPTQIAVIQKDVEYLRLEHDREAVEQKEIHADEKEFRKEVRRRLLSLENASIGIAAVAESSQTKRTRIAFVAVLVFGFSGMIVGIISAWPK
jgi:hypothetical protein